MHINSLSFPFRTQVHVISGPFNLTSRSGKDMECLYQAICKSDSLLVSGILSHFSVAITDFLLF
jgi:hypothetical protein